MRINAPLFCVIGLAIAAPALAETKFDGPYIGAVASLQVHSDKKARTEGTAAFQALPGTVVPSVLRLNDNDGFRGGVLAGWNLSSGRIVYGVEADVLFGTTRGTDRFSGAGIPGLAPDGLATSASRRIRTTGSLRARLGTTLGEDLLLFASGGVALADTRGSADVRVNGVSGLGWDGERTQTRWGWTIGAGAEFKLTSAFSLRGEYLYTDLGRQSVLAVGGSGVRGVAALNGVDYQVGLPYRFGTARVAVIARF